MLRGTYTQVPITRIYSVNNNKKATKLSTTRNDTKFGFEDDGQRRHAEPHNINGAKQIKHQGTPVHVVVSHFFFFFLIATSCEATPG